MGFILDWRSARFVLLAALTAAVLALAPVLGGSASAATVSDPGPFAAEISGGEIKVGNVVQPIADMDPKPTVSGEIDEQGNITIPSSGVSFPVLQEDTGIGMLTVRIQPTGTDWTGTLDPDSGEMTLEGRLRIKFEGVIGGTNLGDNCYAGAAGTGSNIHLNPLTTEAIPANGAAAAMSGSRYDVDSSQASLVNNTATVPSLTGCGLIVLGPALGLPAASGDNQFEFELTFDRSLVADDPSPEVPLPGRESDAVVLKGAQLDGLTGLDPDRVVAFKWDGEWEQVPVQVDERKMVNLRTLYPFTGGYVNNSTAVNIEAYADAGTLAGTDGDPTLDANDEVAFMAMDAGASTTAAAPEGVEPGSGVEIDVSDPIAEGRGYVYLFASDGSLEPSAGTSYVEYDFAPLNIPSGGSLIADYGYWNSSNPEDTVVSTDVYETHSSDRWIDDGLRITAGGATGVDILDREKVLFAPGFCGRSENTFSGNWSRGSDNDEGSFIVSRSGPIRAIRSYIGANSGPYTQREHIYYRDRQDVQTFLRVHAIPSVMSFVDYSPAASGMTYRSSINQAGATVDGSPETLPNSAWPSGVGSGDAVWEQLSGSQGSVTMVSRIATDISPLTAVNYYFDKSNPSTASGNAEFQCTGDAHAYGASGTYITSALPNTDTRSAGFRSLSTVKSHFYGAPGASADDAEARAERVEAPLEKSVSAYVPEEAPEEFHLSFDRGLGVLGQIGNVDLAAAGEVVLDGEFTDEVGGFRVPASGPALATASVPAGPHQLELSLEAPNGVTGSFDAATGKLQFRGAIRFVIDIEGGPVCQTTRGNVVFNTNLGSGVRFTGGLSGSGAVAATWPDLPALTGDPACGEYQALISGPGSLWLASGIASPPGGPVVIAPPSLSGTGIVNTSLTCTVGEFSGVTAGIALEWTRDGVPFEHLNAQGKPARSYVATSADIGSEIACRQTARNSRGETVSTSNAIEVSSRLGPELVTAPALSGSGLVSGVLTCTPGVWSGVTNGVVLEWTRDGVVFGNLNAQGKPSKTYRAQASDVGSEIACRQTAYNKFASTTATSAPIQIAAIP